MHQHTGNTCSPDKTKALKLARQSRGMLEKVIEMIEEDIYCPEIIQQLDAAVGFVRSARRELLAGHLDSCAFERLKEDKKAAVAELLKIYNLQS